MLRDATSGAKHASSTNAVLANSHKKSDADGAPDARNANAASSPDPDSSASSNASCGQPGRRLCCNTPVVRSFPC